MVLNKNKNLLPAISSGHAVFIIKRDNTGCVSSKGYNPFKIIDAERSKPDSDRDSYF